MKKIITFAIMVMVASVSMAQYGIHYYNTKDNEIITYNGTVYTLYDNIKGNGSNNPNDYQYHVVVKENEKLDTTPVFDYTFEDFDELNKYLPELVKMLPKSEFHYYIKVTVIGLFWYSKPYTIDNKRMTMCYIHIPKTITRHIKMFGDCNKKIYRCNIGYIYFDENGAAYHWNYETEEYEMVNPDYYKPVEKININDIKVQ